MTVSPEHRARVLAHLERQAGVKPPANHSQGWTWRSFGGALLLVTVTAGAQIVLSPQRRKPFAIETRDPVTGTLRPIREDDDVARMIRAAPKMLAALKEMVAHHPKSSRPIGAENSAARLHQQDQEAAIDAARAAIAEAEGRS